MAAIQPALVDGSGNIAVHGRAAFVIVVKFGTATPGTYEDISAWSLWFEVSGRFRVALEPGADVYSRKIVVTNDLVDLLPLDTGVPFDVRNETPELQNVPWSGEISAFGYRNAPPGDPSVPGTLPPVSGATVIVETINGEPVVIVQDPAAYDAGQTVIAEIIALGAAVELAIAEAGIAATEAAEAAIAAAQGVAVAAVSTQQTSSIAAVVAQQTASVQAVVDRQVASIAAVEASAVGAADAAIVLVNDARDAAIAAVNASAEAAVAAALTTAELDLAVAASARIFDTEANALAAIAANEYAWIKPTMPGAWAAYEIQKVGGVAVRQYDRNLPLGGPGVGAKVAQVQQQAAEATTPWPQADHLRIHCRAIDAGETDGQAMPNRRVGAPPQKWNMLNFTTGIIRAGLGGGFTITLNDVGTAARVTSTTNGQFTLVQRLTPIPDNYTFAGLFNRYASAGSDQSMRGLQSDNYQTIVATSTQTQLTINEPTHAATLALILGSLSGSAFDVDMDKLQLVEGGASNLLTVAEVPNWHAKGNVAYRGSLPLYTAGGGFQFSMHPTQVFTMVGVADPTTDRMTLPAGHGLVSGAGPFALRASRVYSKTFTTANVDTTADTIFIANHTLVTGMGPFLFSAATLVPPLVALTPYWPIVVDGDFFKVADSYANAMAGIAIDLTAGGAGTQTMTTAMPGGLTVSTPYWLSVVGDTVGFATSAANAIAGTIGNITTTGFPGTGVFLLETYSLIGATLLNPNFPSRFTATYLTVQVTGEWLSRTSNGALFSLIQDSAVTPATGLGTFALYVDDDGEVSMSPNASLNHRSRLRATDMGQQIWTCQFNTVTGDTVLWCGEAPVLTATVYEGLASGAARAPIDILGFWMGRADTASPTIQPTAAWGDTRTSSFKFWDAFLTADEVRQAVRAERIQLSIEGNSEDRRVRVVNVVAGASLQTYSDPVSYVKRVAQDLTPGAVVWNLINCAHSATSLGNTGNLDFIPFYNWTYGTQAAIDGCLANGWLVFFWTNSLSSRDANAIIAGTMTAANFIAFAQQGVNRDPTRVFAFTGPMICRADGNYTTTLENSGVRAAFNAALASHSTAAGMVTVPIPAGIDSTAGIMANSIGDYVHPDNAMYVDWQPMQRAAFDTLYATVISAPPVLDVAVPSQPLTIPIYWENKPIVSETYPRISVPFAWYLDILLCSISCENAPAAQATFTITVNGTTIGTAVIPAGQTDGTVTITDPRPSAGILRVIAPSPADVTLANVSLTLSGYR